MNGDLPDKRKLDVAFVAGFVWTAGGKWASQLVTWISVVVTARLLSPSDFGLMEMAGVSVTLANLLAEFGIGAAVLQMRELDRRVLSQMNTAAVLFSAVACAASFAVAPLLAGFFRSEPLRVLIGVNSLGLLLVALQTVPAGLLQREMDYRRLSIGEAAQAVVQAAGTIVCAVAGLGYWSFVIGAGAGRMVAAGLTMYWQPVPFALPRWRDVARPLRFGIEIALARVAAAASSQADAVVIGRVFGESALGGYRLAMTLASAPAERIGTLIMRVTGPLFARIQHERDLLRRYFTIISEVLALALFPCVFGLAAVAPDVIAVVLGPQWESAAVPLQWLAVFMAFRSLASLVQQVMASLRDTGFLMWMSVLNCVVMPAAFVAASWWGTGAVAASWIVLSPVTLLPYGVRLFRAIDCPFRQYVHVLMPSLAGSAAMILAVWAVGRFLPPGVAPVWRLGIQVAAGGAVYGAVLLGPYRQRVLHYVRFFLNLRKRHGVPAGAER
jgi:PST family polysaccharide transporter